MENLTAREKYVKSLSNHLKCVREAGEKLGVPPIQLYNHDMSKFQEEEFDPYINWFYGKRDNPEAYDKAWLHHIHHNPHHWQYWILPTAFGAEGENDNGCLQMPENYVLEMVADWMGASMAYTGSWDMTDWLKKHLPGIQLHGKSRAYLVGILEGLGYEWAQ